MPLSESESPGASVTIPILPSVLLFTTSCLKIYDTFLRFLRTSSGLHIYLMFGSQLRPFEMESPCCDSQFPFVVIAGEVIGDSKMIVCVAVVGHQVLRRLRSLFHPHSEPANLIDQYNLLVHSFSSEQNNPLYIQSFTEADDALKLHHIVHCSLDVVDERGDIEPLHFYQALAFGNLRYGYLTNTKVKFILVTTDLDVRDADVRNFFRRFHAAYVDAVSNPFHVPGKKITSRTFAESVSTIVKSFGLSSA
nr:trafficking protein particle complex subunit 2-like protein [Ipomoea batatas]